MSTFERAGWIHAANTGLSDGIQELSSDTGTKRRDLNQEKPQPSADSLSEYGRGPGEESSVHTMAIDAEEEIPA